MWMKDYIEAFFLIMHLIIGLLNILVILKCTHVITIRNIDIINDIEIYKHYQQLFC
jgi:hypothetical protein